MTTEANNPTDDTDSDVNIRIGDETIPVEDVNVSTVPSDEFDYMDHTFGDAGAHHEYTGVLEVDLNHPDDTYRVDGAPPDPGVPDRPRPCADPHVVFTTIGLGPVEVAVMQDDADMEAFILAEPSAWITLDEMA